MLRSLNRYMAREIFRGLRNPRPTERIVSASDAAHCIRTQCPDIRFASLHEVAHGWVSVTLEL